MKWNHDNRKLLYQRLLDRFGPCSEWKKRHSPTGESNDYKIFLDDMAIMFNKLTGNECTPGAIEQQICWGIQKTQTVCKGSGFLASFIVNRAVALEVGLINSSDLPSYTLFSDE